MKATTVIFAAIFTLQAGFLFAGNDNAPVTIENSTISLAPVTPVEATFEEVVIINAFASLAPVMPTEATFEDVTDIVVFDLAPLTPAEADF